MRSLSVCSVMLENLNNLSQNPGVLWIGGELKAHPIHTFHCPRLPWKMDWLIPEHVLRTEPGSGSVAVCLGAFCTTLVQTGAGSVKSGFPEHRTKFILCHLVRTSLVFLLTWQRCSSREFPQHYIILSITSPISWFSFSPPFSLSFSTLTS